MRGHLHRHLVAPVSGMLLVAALAGCGQRTETSTTTDTAANPPATTTAPELSDANIAAVVVDYNNEEIAHAKVAQQKATRKEVKEFAQRMITDHTAVNQQATALATKLSLTPEENDLSRKLTSDGATFREGLNTRTGADFDRAYIDNEVALHQLVLDQIDTHLIPEADNAELKTLLQNTRPAVQAHLDHAKQIQTQLGAN